MSLTRLVTPFKAWHYDWLGLGAPMSQTDLQAMELQNSWTGVADGEIVACAGTIRLWQGRYQAWAHMSEKTGKHMRWLTREVRRNLDGLKGRIEMTVQHDFEAGHRWAKLLGFTVETPLMPKFGPDGSAHTGYVRFR